MALHFSLREFDGRLNRLKLRMAEHKLDCVLLFAQESMYWLTGYDTFGYCFFQCLVVKSDGQMVLLTRAPDLRQARHTSNIENIIVWEDRGDSDPTGTLLDLLREMDLLSSKIGVEYDTVGLNARYGKLLGEKLSTLAELSDASDIVANLRVIKSPAELEHTRRAGQLADLALDAAIAEAKAGADEGDILAAMHAATFSAGGDYPANEFIIGSGRDALLCRYKSGRRKLDKNDQLTLEWAGTWAHYHAAMMRTLIVGKPSARHLELYQAAHDALLAVREAMQVGNRFADMFDAHADTLDKAGLAHHRLNACGYSLGATFTPCWMDPPMMYAGNERLIEAGMVLFTHMIIADSDAETAMTLGLSYITTEDGPEPLSQHNLELIVR